MSLAELERRRAELYRELGLGDFRRGSLNEVRRNCGKPGCACAAAASSRSRAAVEPDAEGRWEGRTRAVHLKPGPELEKARREVAEYERFRALVGQVTGGERGDLPGPPGGPGRRPGGGALPGTGGGRGLRDALAPERPPS